MLNVSASAVSHRIRQPRSASRCRAVSPQPPRRSADPCRGKLALRPAAPFARWHRPESAVEAAGQRRLRLKVLPQFASAWLIPRLSSFLTRHSEADLAIETSNRNVDFDATGTFDAGISFGPDKPDGVAAHRLMEVRTVPVGAPALARRLKLRSAADLGGAVRFM